MKQRQEADAVQLVALKVRNDLGRCEERGVLARGGGRAGCEGAAQRERRELCSHYFVPAVVAFVDVVVLLVVGFPVFTPLTMASI